MGCLFITLLSQLSELSVRRGLRVKTPASRSWGWGTGAYICIELVVLLMQNSSNVAAETKTTDGGGSFDTAHFPASPPPPSPALLIYSQAGTRAYCCSPV
jgi:hypothetical protein